MVIYMGFAPSTTSLFNTVNTGEAPTLSSSYGEYDNGVNVFTNYWNFAGTNLPSGWTIYGTAPTINNGVTFSTSSMIETSSKFPITNILESDITIPPSGTANGGFAYVVDVNGNPYTFTSYWIAGGSSTGSFYSGITAQVASNSNSGSISGLLDGNYVGGTVGSGLGNTGLFSITATSSVNFGMYNYKVYTNAIDLAPAGNYYIAYGGGSDSGLSFNWLRTRVFPPNGVMPSVAFDSIS
jgi:hypothetical protein